MIWIFHWRVSSLKERALWAIWRGFISAGAMYHHGQVVKQDKTRAFELYQLAGEGGSIEGWKNVVACYMMGDGVPKCENTANYIIKTMLQGGKE